MALDVRAMPLPSKAAGLAVRPQPSSGSGSSGPESPDQVLVFTEEGAIHELEGAGRDGGGLKLGPQLAKPGAGCRFPALDSGTGAVYFCERTLVGTRLYCVAAVSKLGPSNDCSLVAGSKQRNSGQEAVFKNISALTTDGRGGLWVVDSGSPRRLDTPSGKVTSGIPIAELASGSGCLAFDAAAGRLLAATSTAVSRLCTEEGGGVELVAGSGTDKGSVDGSGATARFSDISALLPLLGGRLLIAEGPNLRCMDAGGAVTTLLQGCFLAGGRVTQLTALPGGELAALCGGGASLVLIAGASLSPAPSTNELVCLLRAPVEGDGNDGSSAGGAVTVRVGDGAVLAHRSVLAAGSEYFARLLAPGGGFAESGAAEVALPDADPAAFAHLLSYMYGSTFGVPCTPSQLLQSVPCDLLRPTAALAGRLLMRGAVVSALTDQIAAGAAPSTVLSTLIWAEDHGLDELAAKLRIYAIEHRKILDLRALTELIAAHPKRASEVVSGLLRA